MFVFPLITFSVIASLLAVLVPTRRKSTVFISFFQLALCTLWWHGSWILLFMEEQQQRAEVIAVLGHLSILYLPVAYNKLYAEMLGIRTHDKLFRAIYFVMLALLLSTRLIIDGVHQFSWGFYPKAGLLHPLFIGLVAYVAVDSAIRSAILLRDKSNQAKSKAIKTGILACVIFSLGSFDFLLNYRLVDFFPIGFVSSILFVIIIAIGIVGYDLFQKESQIQDLNRQNDTLLNSVEKERIRLQEKEKFIQQISRQNHELRVRDEIISSFVSPTVRSEIALGENPLAYRPQKFLRSVVFIDMRDFTKIAEKIELDQIFSLVNSYFDLVNKAVYSNQGEVNKYLGDGVLALFEDPRHCLTAISNFLGDLQELNRAQLARQGHKIELGIGISFGEVLCGNFGSDTKLERSVIGDVVNIASRLEKLSKTYACQVICDEFFIQEVQDCEFFRPIGIEVLKGRSKATIIYEICFSSFPEEILYRISTRPILMLVLEYYKEGLYTEALSTLNSINNQCGLQDVPLETLRQFIAKQVEMKNERRLA